MNKTETFPVQRTEEEWRRMLTPEQYHIMREHGTERPGSCALNTEKRAGTFYCAGFDQCSQISSLMGASSSGCWRFHHCK